MKNTPKFTVGEHNAIDNIADSIVDLLDEQIEYADFSVLNKISNRITTRKIGPDDYQGLFDGEVIVEHQDSADGAIDEVMASDEYQQAYDEIKSQIWQFILKVVSTMI